MRVRAALLLGMLTALGGCSALSGGLGVDTSDAGPPPFPECQAERYAFAGRGTFAALGLVGQSAATLPDPDRPAMIWVTRDPVPFDAAGPAGSRMLCFAFDDGSGGSEWPVNAEWQPPGTGVAAQADINPATPLMLVAALTVIVVGIIAFRRR